MRLTELLAGQTTVERAAMPEHDPEVLGLSADSREIRPGWLFAALPGRTTDGRRFIDDALQRGAIAVLAEPGTQVSGDGAQRLQPAVPVILDSNPRRRLAQLAARYYGNQPAKIAAVTGTNGKTSVAWFLRQIWEQVGHRAACLGTLGLHAPAATKSGTLTTPDAVELASMLADLAANGVDRVALEASSHGLDQYRLDGVRVTIAAFTNLSRDHLDYHGTVEAYFAAKRRLFAEVLSSDGVAVLNADTPHAQTLAEISRRRGIGVLTFGHARDADLRVDRVSGTEDGQHLDLTLFGEPWQVTLPLAGAFQASNALAAALMAIASGEAAGPVMAALHRLRAVPGRLERVAQYNGARVFVDYAHTPDALAAVLRALRPICRGRLVVVFGCGGDRDAGKRPEMGSIAASLADRIVITDDNPRTEPSAAIRRAVLEGCPGAIEIGDRRDAIAAAMRMLAAGDVLLVAGKGHETGQIVGDAVHPFDDRQVVRSLADSHCGDAPVPEQAR